MQAIKYKWFVSREHAEPFLIFRNGLGLERMQLLGQGLAVTIGKKTCIGYQKDGRHFPCPHSRILDFGWNCNECRLNDDYFLCMRCTGEECINLKQRAECKELIYYIYLAAFGGLLKVGISLERRIMERLVEQGADLGAMIALVKDGKEVRLVEQQIAKELNITDRIRGAQKHGLIFGNPNAAAINIFNAIQRLRQTGMKMINPEIYDLRPYYRLHNVLADPQRVDVSDGCKISGSVVAAKGNILIMENQGGFYSLNSHELIGRELAVNNLGQIGDTKSISG